MKRGHIDQTWDPNPSWVSDSTTVRVVVENQSRPLSAKEIACFSVIAKAVEEYLGGAW